MVRIQEAFQEQLPPFALGLSSVVLAAIALALFFLPVIAIPIAGCAVAAAVLGMLGVLFRSSGSLRLCIAGLLLGGFDVGAISALNAATDGYFTPRSVFPVRQATPNRPFVAPPAPPRAACRRGLSNQQTFGSNFASGQSDPAHSRSVAGVTRRPLTTC
jgi:hypothetical protein